jgi:hypothetical protein
MLNFLQEMNTAMVTYRAYRIPEATAVSLIISGFTGLLRAWWDNYLTPEDRENIKNHVVRIVNENDEVIEERNDSFEVLVANIAVHFMGDPQDEKNSSQEVLNNLKISTMDDYQWYRDTYLSYVLRRSDCAQASWKERFVSGLPPTFSQRIFAKLRERVGQEDIPWSSISYGHLFTFIKHQGILCCNELKMQSKHGKERDRSRREMGSFCEAYGCASVLSPTARRRKKQKLIKKYRSTKRYSKQDYQNPTPRKRKNLNQRI